MLARTAFLLSLVLVSAQPGRAEPHASHPAAAALDEQPSSLQSHLHPLGVTRQPRTAIVISPASAWGAAAAGPHVHAGPVRRIAIYESVGNRFGAEILRNRLDALGVAKDEVNEVAAWTKIHGRTAGNGSAAASPLGDPKPTPTEVLY